MITSILIGLGALVIICFISWLVGKVFESGARILVKRFEPKPTDVDMFVKDNVKNLYDRRNYELMVNERYSMCGKYHVPCAYPTRNDKCIVTQQACLDWLNDLVLCSKMKG
jgi:hypothetical protein